MTVEEIKQQNSMRDVVVRYGIEVNRSGFCRCPFHSERTASMKIYRDSFYCFGCHAGGDIFAFIQKIEGVDFKTAFESLGGTYESRDSFSGRLALYKSMKRAEQRKLDEAREKEKRRKEFAEIRELRRKLEEAEPMSDEWRDIYNRLQIAKYEAGLEEE